MAMASFTNLDVLKPLMGYAPHETSQLTVAMKELKDPKVVITEAEKVHKALAPNVAGYAGILQANDVSQSIRALSVLPEDAAHQAAREKIQITSGDLETLFATDDTIAVSQELADSLNVAIGDEVSLEYESKFEGTADPKTYQVAAVFAPDASVASDSVFLNSEAMYDTFFPMLPKEPVLLDAEHPLFNALIKEWMLLERSPTSEALQKKLKELRNTDWDGATMDVTTMYEAASFVLQMESVLKMVTMIAVLILFFIILIGVINTLRMTIRERTREIGTVRAIGMQRADVGRTFMTEVMLLTLFASIVGIILAFLIMKIVGFIPIHDEGFFSIFLVDTHLHFVPTLNDVVTNLVMIMIITFLTAFFPSRRAAKMSVSSALRHYE
jgi:ABC-type lipoprotein release transport system permease subunit